MNDNRASVLTPPGSGAIAVVRVVGPDAVSIVDRIFQPKGDTRLASTSPDRLRYGLVVDGDETLDDVVVSITATLAPSAVDICAHGGVRVVERVLSVLGRGGATLDNTGAHEIAHPWPVANRIEGEAIVSMTRAHTARALAFLSHQKTLLPDVLNRVAGLCLTDPARAAAGLRALLDGFTTARHVLDGVTLAIVGPPNSGKSTLFNRLVGRCAAIVSARAGTTRDWVTGSVDMDGIPVTLVDTAGGVHAEDGLEQQAIRAGRVKAQRADVRVLVLDGSTPLPAQLDVWLDQWASSSPAIVAINKRDKPSSWDQRALPLANHGQCAEISAATGDGIDDLCGCVIGCLGLGDWDERTPSLFTRRQVDLAESLCDVVSSDGPNVAKQIIDELIGPLCPSRSAEPDQAP